MASPARRAVVVGLAWLATAATCTPPPIDDERPRPEPPAQRRRPPRPPRARTDVLEGKVRWGGDVPGPRRVELPEMAERECTAARSTYERIVRTDTTQGLASSFVVLRGLDDAPRPEPRTVAVKIRGCALDPFVIDATVGDTLEIENEDLRPVACGLKEPGGATPERQAIAPSGKLRIPLTTKGGRLIDCTPDRPWMIGHLLVARHRFHAVTDAHGDFRIEGVPPGRYEVEAWHPAQRRRTVEIEVRAGTANRVDITLEGNEVARAPVPARPEPEPERIAPPEPPPPAPTKAPAPEPPPPAPTKAPPAPEPPPPAPTKAPAPPPPPAPTKAPAAVSPPAPTKAPPAAAPTPPEPEPTGTPAEQAVEHLRRARAAAASGNHAVAAREFRVATELRPTMPPAWKGLGEAEAALGNAAAAIRAYRRYLLVAPTAGDAPAIRGRLRGLGAAP